MKTHLEIGDKIKRFELSKEIEFEYVVASLTKTQAKTADGYRFKRELNYNVTKPNEKCVAEVYKIGHENSKRYFLI